ncbi:hypothetical protein FHP25_06035 [Vineibacter terrae]|uniref:Uncharacterized protein n=1 Tax=Vineibacter terrae TaxID=2586908 RepID=A0A5C8PSQ2_9HYPH|nr:hypothetical protein [Vineibacter terrae]TXL79502.1 hypothetical protein FHP25_06035 [Vineibacter terrae]
MPRQARTGSMYAIPGGGEGPSTPIPGRPTGKASIQQSDALCHHLPNHHAEESAWSGGDDDMATFNYRETQIIKGMLLRGDKQHDIAAYFGENGGRIAEVATGNTTYPKANTRKSLIHSAYGGFDGLDQRFHISVAHTLKKFHLEKHAQEIRPLIIPIGFQQHIIHAFADLGPFDHVTNTLLEQGKVSLHRLTTSPPHRHQV